MKTKTILFAVLSIAFLGAVIFPKAAEAYRGDPNVKGPNYTEERHTAMLKAIENKDAAAVKNLMQGKGVSYRLGDDMKKWSRFVEMQSLQHGGKADEAAKIRTELGLGLRNGSGRGQGMGRMNK